MKNKTLYIILLIIALLAVIKIVFLKQEDSAMPQGNKPGGGSANATGYVVELQTLVNTIASSGSVLANEEVELRPETSGKLISIGFKEGGLVQKGALLVKINDADLQATLKKLNLQLALTKQKEARLKSMLDIKGVSQEEYDAVANQLQTIGADIDYTNAEIAKTEIRAPFSGKVGLKNISEGSFVNSTTIIANVQQTDLLKIDFTVPEKYASIVVVGDSILFSIEGVKEKFAATVSAIEPKINVQTRNINVRALFKNNNGMVYPGAFAKVELVASKSRSSFMIPTEAVIPDLKGKKVFVCKNGKAMPVKVETGMRNDSKIEITNGLNPGDTVITTGIMSLKPEMSVKIIQVKK